jgi:23S rRNA (uracil1939-C5)-methyltransferase
LFTLPLRKKVGTVRAVESGGAAWRDLQFNAEAAELPVEALQTSAENFLAANSATADFVLADPPRAGLGKAAVQALVAAKPQRLTIVSCDPATLARDLAALLPVFEIERMAMIDLFPQTYHIETVTHLRLK